MLIDQEKIRSENLNDIKDMLRDLLININRIYSQILIEGGTVLPMLEKVSQAVQEMVFDGEVKQGVGVILIAKVWENIVRVANEKV